MKKWVYDFILGLTVLLLSIAALAYAYFLEAIRTTDFLARPDVYLALWMILLALLGALLMIRAWRSRGTEENQAKLPPIWESLPVWTAAILLVYLLLLDKLGFILDSILMLWFLTFLYAMNSGEEKKDGHDRRAVLAQGLKSSVFAVASSIAVYLLFTRILSTKLPTFSLFH